MKSGMRRNLLFAMLFFGLFLVLVLLLCTVDVQPTGAVGNAVGLSHINGAVYALCGEHAIFYHLTEALGFVSLGVMLVMALLGLMQWLRRKQLLCVDAEVLSLVPLYLGVVVLYALFEVVVINCRPNAVEASFPSSHTMLAICVFGSALTVVKARCHSAVWRGIWSGVACVLCVLMVAGRLLAGVHWFTDILGGVLLSLGLLSLYRAICDRLRQKTRQNEE